MKITGIIWDWKDKPSAEELNLMLGQIKEGHFVDANIDLSDNFGIIYTDGNVTPEQAGRLLETMEFFESELWETENVVRLIQNLEEADRRNAFDK